MGIGFFLMFFVFGFNDFCSFFGEVVDGMVYFMVVIDGNLVIVWYFILLFEICVVFIE